MRVRAGVGGVDTIGADLADAKRLCDEADQLLQTQGVVYRPSGEATAITPDQTPEDEVDRYS